MAALRFIAIAFALGVLVVGEAAVGSGTASGATYSVGTSAAPRPERMSIRDRIQAMGKKMCEKTPESALCNRFLNGRGAKAEASVDTTHKSVEKAAIGPKAEASVDTTHRFASGKTSDKSFGLPLAEPSEVCFVAVVAVSLRHVFMAGV
eukprot:CAMPEP_0117557334 /NCGR_PEP_ID=MMETSP0784-20121206/52274_1 /TAXON_ID=39447 /ORGANISM="" /LENGTH=148 /DNA_ID=CAMNT_0005354643 /DNA_START=37 /DNA_END=483 /DNA_ORIENTATION=-